MSVSVRVSYAFHLISILSSKHFSWSINLFKFINIMLLEIYYLYLKIEALFKIINKN